jgi:folate-binding protein YgfZ
MAQGQSPPMTPTLADWPEWQHGPWHIGPATVRIIRAPLMGATPGFMIMADSRDAETVRDVLEQSGARHGTGALWDVARVEAGRPAWGVDMDDNTIPQEANLDALGAISFTKGCYTGQETVARLHFRGHVNRRLRGLLGAAALPRHGQIVDASGKVVGDVRSTAMSPTRGPIAIAMLRREVSEGDTVLVEGRDGPITAEVRELPFSA